jgi:hypothetical protein
LSNASSSPLRVGAGRPGSAGKSRASAARSSSVRSSSLSTIRRAKSGFSCRWRTVRPASRSARSTAGTSRSTASAVRPKKSRSLSLPLHLAAGDQSSSAGERESPRLLPGRRRSQQPAAAAGSALWMAPEPAGPGAPNRGWQHELVEELAQLLGLDVEAHVLLGAFSQDLLVDAGTVRAVGQVVGYGRPRSSGCGTEARRGLSPSATRDRPGPRAAAAAALRDRARGCGYVPSQTKSRGVRRQTEHPYEG